jgi:5-methylcytosine-specific restriction endonuclease McrA
VKEAAVSTDSTTPLKHCPKCGRDLPATVEYFSRCKQNRDGLYSYCKDCKCAAERVRYADNPEARRRTLDRVSQYAKEHPELRRRIGKRYYEAHHDQELARVRKYRAENKHVQRAWYDTNRDRVLEYSRQYRLDNLERYRNQWKEYYQTHKAEAMHRLRVRRAREKGADGGHTLADLREIRAGQTDKRGRLRCWYCGKPIKGAPHLDHKTPLARGGSNGPENLCYACGPCNLSKSSKTPAEYAGRIV